MTRFVVESDENLTLVFEPAAEEYALDPGESVLVEWSGGHGPGTIKRAAGDLVIWPPDGGLTRAWRSDGSEIYVGPESGPESS